ncbi:hypothetical protein [Streptacidiphilus rugosus]|uniref:hypothetical protein n=1 Tax=Streptacidiphilus rugosus TaxID=405783 RepID=UPI0005663063|nr:hypothetical protein [Streptacidiphilus rugosus]
MSDEEILGFLIEDVRGDGVVVKVCRRESEPPVVERAAGSWADLAALGAEYSVSEERWSITDEARAVLDATAAGPHVPD